VATHRDKAAMNGAQHFIPLHEAGKKAYDRVTCPPAPNGKPYLVRNMRIGDGDLRQFALAVLAFWHFAGASPLP